MDFEALQALPKVELHNHLDGGLRPQTVIELAAEAGYGGLPTTDVNTLRNWFDQGDSGSLEAYLQSFEHTIAVMQTAAAIERVAFEAIEDLAADGVIYAEIRFAPSLNTRGGLRREDVIQAALLGLQRGSEATGVVVGLIIDAMRNATDSLAVARAATRFIGQGVVGFDLAGPEKGFAADDHLPACRLAQEYGLGLTIHAGEADGPSSIHRAVARCGAVRIGHGIRITDDFVVKDGKASELGGVASLVRDRQLPLEVCPHSNLHTLGISAAEHPVGVLRRSGFNVTLNTDNRLMSGVSLTDEFAFVVQHHGFTREDLRSVTLAGLNAAFVDNDVRRRLIDVIVAGYAN
ncbi:MAG: adenosine deaminase [Acidimicrobiia bacterium]|nr:adenosine deaminase [Acidimicrobiia bacterium]